MVRRSLSAAIVLALGAAAPELHAQGIATADGAFARLARERAVVVWDAPAKAEHLVLKVELDTDAKEVALFVPLPARPRVVAAEDALTERVAALSPSAAVSNPAVRFDWASGDVLESEARLSSWLGEHGLAERPALRSWAGAAFARGALIAALRYAEPPPPPPPPGVTIVRGQGAPARKVALGPAVRLSFPSDGVFFPYSEPAGDIAGEAAYLAKYGEGDHPHLAPRPLDVWLVADGAWRAKGQDLPLASGAMVAASAASKALGDTHDWPFDPSSRASFALLHFSEPLSPARLAFDNLLLEPAEMPDLHEATVVTSQGPSAATPSSPVPLVLAAAFGAAVATLVSVGVMRRRRR